MTNPIPITMEKIKQKITVDVFIILPHAVPTQCLRDF